MSADDVAALRAHALSDEAILIAVQVIAYFNAINRVADALDVEPEAWMTPDRATWLAQKATFRPA